MGRDDETVTYAMAGLQLQLDGPADAWIVRNATLPDGWATLSFERVMLGGEAYRLEAAHGARAVLQLVAV